MNLLITILIKPLTWYSRMAKRVIGEPAPRTYLIYLTCTLVTIPCFFASFLHIFKSKNDKLIFKMKIDKLYDIDPFYTIHSPGPLTPLRHAAFAYSSGALGLCCSAVDISFYLKFVAALVVNTVFFVFWAPLYFCWLLLYTVLLGEYLCNSSRKDLKPWATTTPKLFKQSTILHLVWWGTVAPSSIIAFSVIYKILKYLYSSEKKTCSGKTLLPRVLGRIIIYLLSPVARRVLYESYGWASWHSVTVLRPKHRCFIYDRWYSLFWELLHGPMVEKLAGPVWFRIYRTEKRRLNFNPPKLEISVEAACLGAGILDKYITRYIRFFGTDHYKSGNCLINGSPHAVSALLLGNDEALGYNTTSLVSNLKTRHYHYEFYGTLSGKPLPHAMIQRGPEHLRSFGKLEFGGELVHLNPAHKFYATAHARVLTSTLSYLRNDLVFFSESPGKKPVLIWNVTQNSPAKNERWFDFIGETCSEQGSLFKELSSVGVLDSNVTLNETLRVVSANHGYDTYLRCVDKPDTDSYI